MTTYPPFDALRARIRESRLHGVLVTSPAIATRRFQVVAEMVIGPMLRHLVHVLWQEGVPASIISELDGDPPHMALRTDELAVAVYFWASADPDQLLWAIHSGDGYGDIHAVHYDVLSPARLASLLENILGALLGLSSPAGVPTVLHRSDAPSAVEGTGHPEPAM